MAAAKRTSKVVSIQAKRPKPSRAASRAKWLQGESLASAYRHGQPWDDDDVSRMVAGVERNETAYELAISLGRSYYSMVTARGHIAFALRHEAAIWGNRLRRKR